MDTLFICVCLLAFFTHPLLGQSPPLEVTFENDTRIDVSEGAEQVIFKCHLNRGAMFVINNNVAMVHVDPISNKETIITKSAEHVEGSAEFYSIKIQQPPGNTEAMDVKFTIEKVRYQDDGKYVCRVTPGPNNPDGETAEAEREIVVHRPMSALRLKFGELDSITESPSDPIMIDHGKYDVSCTAEGSNPGTTDVHLYFHGKMVDHDDPVPTLMEGPHRKYSTKVAGKVDIMVSNSGQEFECQAKDSSGTTKSVKLAVSVNVYDPEVTCNDTEAFHGQENPILYCTVNHTDVEVDGYAYQMGDTGEIFRPGDNNEKKIVVSMSDVAPGITVVSMDLHRAEHEYLDKNYYILIDIKGGHTSKEMVRLHKTEKASVPPIDDDIKPGNGASGMTSISFLCALMCLLLWSL